MREDDVEGLAAVVKAESLAGAIGFRVLNLLAKSEMMVVREAARGMLDTCGQREEPRVRDTVAAADHSVVQSLPECAKPPAAPHDSSG